MKYACLFLIFFLPSGSFSQASSEEKMLQSLAESRDWNEFATLAEQALSMKSERLLALFHRKMSDFPKQRGSIARFCYRMNLPQGAFYARKWIREGTDGVRFWSSLILLRHGDREKLEGLPQLADVLDRDSGMRWFPLALPDLLAIGNEATMQLAGSVLHKKTFIGCKTCYSGIHAEMVHRLFWAGSEECLDYLLTHLDGSEVVSTLIDVQQNRFRQTRGDLTARMVSSWRSDGVDYNPVAPEEERKERRKEIKKWVMEQFRRLKERKTPDMKRPAPF